MFCGIRCIFDFLGCEIPTVLSGPFFLIINCLFTCFDRIVVPSVKSGCHIKPARGTGNFGIILFSSGNRHKFTSMFSCASLVHPCTSVAGVKKGILRVPNRRCSRYPHAGRQNAVYCQTWERLLIIKERKILQVEVPASYIQTFRCFWEKAFSSSSPTCTTFPAIHHSQKGVHYALGHTYAHCFFYRQ